MTTFEDHATMNRPFKVEFELAEKLAWTITEQAPWRQLIEQLGERIPDRNELPLTLELSVGTESLVSVTCGQKGPGSWSLNRQNCSDFDQDPNVARNPNYEYQDII